VTWSYVVTNTGGVPLTDIIVVDDDGTPYDPYDDITFTSVNNAKLLFLAPGESVTLNASGIVVAGQYANYARVLSSQQVSDADNSHYFGGTAAPKSKPKVGIVPKDDKKDSDKTDAEKEADKAEKDAEKAEKKVKKVTDAGQKAAKKALDDAQEKAKKEKKPKKEPKEPKEPKKPKDPKP
jgi:hypothetical protein